MKYKLILDTSFAIESSDGSAPSAFRIWKAGVNKTDHGDVLFTKDSAKYLIDEQTKRRNLYSIDYDHLSLKDNRPATSGQAAGWHKLEIRDTKDGPELWATEVEWCQESKEGLEAKPPKWRYFSPAYRLNEDNEVVSYLNTALCINPATWDVTQLATTNAQLEKSQQEMNQENLMEDMLKMLASIVDDSNQPEDVRAAAALLKEALMKGSESEVEVVVESKQDVVEEDPKEKEKKMDTKKTMELQLATRVAELEAQIEKQKVDALVTDNIGKRIPKSLETWARAQNMETIKTYLASAPTLDSVKDGTIETPTRGDKSNIDSTSKDSKGIDQVLGLKVRSGKFGMDNKLSSDGTYSVGFLTPSEARKLKLSK